MIDVASIPVVRFCIAGVRLAIPAGAVAAMALEGEAAGSVEDLLGLAPDGKTPSRILTLRIHGADTNIRVPGEVTMRDLPVDAIHPLPDLVRARIGLRGVAALALEDDGVILVIDPTKL